MPSPAAKWLNVPADRAGRVRVNSDCSVPVHPEVFVIGDTASLDQDGKALPGVAQVALQQGRYVGKVIGNRENGHPAPQSFHYSDRGNIGGDRARLRKPGLARCKDERASGVAGMGFRPHPISPGLRQPTKGLDAGDVVVF